MQKMPRKLTLQQDQSARFREAAKKAEVGDGKAFERAFKKIVPVKKKTQSRRG